MVKRVIWSERAKNERREILEFWRKHSGNKTFSKKLSKEFREATNLLSRFNYLGIKTDESGIRMTVVRHYLIFYQVQEQHIQIITLWDSRRNPDTLKG